jgi:nitrite reductase (NADH) large subunit
VDGLLTLSGAAAAGAAPAAGEKAVCGCLPLSRPALRDRVLELGLRSPSAVLQELGDGVGCHRCKPALGYYLDVWWCGEHTEETAARHVNDRVHANIQHDGTFSVVPRIRGGMTSPAELRRIADVAERYDVPTVKITGGQRIDLLGVRKEVLPAVWHDLGMPSGFAYTKAIRTVKSCVGSEWCRFGVGDSTDLAVRLEELVEGLYTPHKVKMGVIQYYREHADYLERLYHFVPRIGIEAFRGATFEAAPEDREGLLSRFRRSKANTRDPWGAVPAEDPSRFEPAGT